MSERRTRAAAFRGLKIFLAVSWVCIAAFGLIARRHIVPEPAVGLPQLFLAFPQAHHFSEEMKNPARRDACARDGSLLGCVVRSRDLAPGVRGYSGAISLLVGVMNDGRIAGVTVLDHSETPSYVRGLPDWLNVFRGRSVAERLRVGTDLDGMTGATITSQAIADGVRISGRSAARKLYGVRVPDEEARRFPMSEAAKIFTSLLLFGLAVFSIVKKKERLRWVTLGLGIILVGFVYNFQLSVLNLSAIVSLKPSLSLSFWVFFGLSILAALFLGRVYCNWICPFGALQEIGHRVLRRSGEPPPAHRSVEILKYIILWETTLAAILTANLAHADYEPFMTLFARRGTALLWLFLGVVLFFSLLRYRFWCRYFCALGGFYHMVSRLRFLAKPGQGGADD